MVLGGEPGWYPFELLLPFGLFEDLVAFPMFGLLVAFKALFEDLDALVPLESFPPYEEPLPFSSRPDASSSNRRREQMTLIPCLDFPMQKRPIDDDESSVPWHK
jgi:hypothetical protein